MNHLSDIDEEDEHIRHRGAYAAPDREITLGTTMILLIFFTLAIYGAALFGFGYSMGSKHTAGSGPSVIAGVSPSLWNGAKPSPGLTTGGTGKPLAIPDATPIPEAAAPVTRTVPLADASDNPAPPAAEPDEHPVARPVTPGPTVPGPAPVTSSAPIAVAPGTVSLVVQVAAVSHSQDADMMAAALQHRGYAVNIRIEPDKLFHVQVGPFTTKKDADAMRTRLLADGFNAYIK